MMRARGGNLKVPRPRALFAHLGISRGWLRSSGILEAGRRTPDGNRGRGSVPVPGKSGTGTGELSQSVPDSGKSGTGTGTGARRPVSAPCFDRRMLGNGHRQSALHAVGSNLNTEIGAPLCIYMCVQKCPPSEPVQVRVVWPWMLRTKYRLNSQRICSSHITKPFERLASARMATKSQLSCFKPGALNRVHLATMMGCCPGKRGLRHGWRCSGPEFCYFASMAFAS